MSTFEVLPYVASILNQGVGSGWEKKKKSMRERLKGKEKKKKVKKVPGGGLGKSEKSYFVRKWVQNRVSTICYS